MLIDKSKILSETILSNNLIIGRISTKRIGKEWGIYTKNHEIVVPFKYAKIEILGNNRIKVYEKNGEYGAWGVIDEKGRIIVECEYEELGKFINGKIKAKNKYRKWGYLNAIGEIVIPFEYYELNEFIDGKARAQNESGKWGYLNEQGEIVIPFEYEQLGEFINGKAKAKDESGKWGYLNEQGEIIIPFDYKQLGEFINGKVSAQKVRHIRDNYKYEDGVCHRHYRPWGCLNEQGEVIIPFKYQELEITNRGIKVKEGGKWSYLNEHGEVVTPWELGDSTNENIEVKRYNKWENSNFQYEEIQPLTDGKIKARKGYENWGVLNEHGEVILPFQYGEITSCIKGNIIARKKQSDLWGVLNEAGEEVIPFEYISIKNILKEKFACWKYVREPGNMFSYVCCGMIDEYGKIIIPFEYSKIEEFTTNKVKVCKNSKWGILNAQGETIIPFEYDKIEDIIDGVIKILKNGEFGYINEKNEVLISTETTLSNGLYKGKKLGKWGVYSDENNIIIPFEYYEIGDIHSNMIKACRQLRGYWGVLDLNGNEVIPFKYNQIGDFEDGIVKAYNGYCWGCLDEHGEILITSQIPLSNGLFKGEKWGKWGIYSEDDQIIVPFEYGYIDDFEDGKIFVIKNGFPGYLNENGETLPMSPYTLSNGYIRKEKLGKYGVCSPAGKIVIPFEYDVIEDFVNGRIKVCKKSQQHEQTLWGFLDDKGKVIIPCEYDQLGSFENGKIIAAKLGEKEEMRWGCLDYEGNVILPFWYYYLENIKGNKVKAVIDRNEGWVEMYVGDKSGILVSSEKKLSNGYLKGEKFGLWGVYTDDNKIILPFQYTEEELDDKIETGELTEQQPDNTDSIRDRKYWSSYYPGEDEWFSFIFDPLQELSDKKLKHLDDEISQQVWIEDDNIDSICLSNGFIKSMRNRKWGICSEIGNVIIPFEYDYIGDFKNGIIKARKGHFCGYYDEQGNVLIPFEYYSLGELVEGKIKACKRGKWGAIDINNRIVVPFEFDGIEDFKNEEAIVYWWNYETSSMWQRTVNNKGELSIDSKEHLTEELLKGMRLDKWGVYKTTGEIILPFIFDQLIYIQHIGIMAYFDSECLCSIAPSGELTKCTYILNNNFYKVWCLGKWGVYSANHEIALPFVYDSLGDFYERKISAKKNGFWGVVDEHNRMIIPFLYDDIGEFNEGKIVACKNGKWGCLDLNAREIIPFEYDYLEGFKNGLCKFRKGDGYSYNYSYDDELGYIPVPAKGEYGYLNKNGVEVIPGRCPKIGNLSEDKIVAYHNSIPNKVNYANEELPWEYRTGWVCFNSKGETLLFFEKKFKQWNTPYHKFGDFHEGKIKVQQHDYWGCANIEGELIIPSIYEDLGDFCEGKIAAKEQGGFWGYLDEQGEVIIPFKYSEAHNFHFGIACVQQYDGKWGAIDAAGNIIVPFEYEKMGDFDGEKIKILEETNGVPIVKYIKLK